MFTVICDNCGKDIGSEQDFSCWGDEDTAKENAIDSDWVEHEEKHYCPECHDFNSDDEIIIDESRKDKYKS